MKKAVTILAIAIFILLIAFLWQHPNIKEWRHDQKFKTLPTEVYRALCYVDEFNFSPCRQLNQCPTEIKAWCTMYPDIPGEYNATIATPYYFKFRGGEGHLVIFHKKTSAHERADAFWLDDNGKCWIIHSGTSITPEYSKHWKNEVKLPDNIYTALRYFEIEKNSLCSMVDTFPKEILDWHPNIYTIIDDEIDRSRTTSYFFRNANNKYLLIWDDIDTLYLWIDSNEVRNRMAEYRENFRE